jgi:hypothetical protein
MASTCENNVQIKLTPKNFLLIVFFSTNGYLSLKFEHFAVLSKNICYYFDNKNFIREIGQKC